MINELETVAIKQARKYFNSVHADISQTDAEFIKVKETLKLVIIPNKLLENYFSSVSDTEAKEVFKNYAMFVHPDRNRHPSARIAFKKLFKAFRFKPVRVDMGN